MRKLLFNPLAQKPYASGEYDSVENKFIIDKPLEYGNLYIAQVRNTDEDEISTTILDLTRPSSYAVASLHLTDSNHNYEPFYMFVSKSTPTRIEVGSVQAQILSNKLVIYIYKVF